MLSGLVPGLRCILRCAVYRAGCSTCGWVHIEVSLWLFRRTRRRDGKAAASNSTRSLCSSRHPNDNIHTRSTHSNFCSPCLVIFWIERRGPCKLELLTSIYTLGQRDIYLVPLDPQADSMRGEKGRISGFLVKICRASSPCLVFPGPRQ